MAICEDCKQDMLNATTTCTHKWIEIDGEIYQRLLYNDSKCRDCGITSHNIHHYGCDVEICPKCGGQLINCNCRKGKILKNKPKPTKTIGIPKKQYKIHTIEIPYITMELVKKYHSLAEVQTFIAWMSGQTGMVVNNPDGTNEMAIYAEDYERWLKEGKKTKQNPLT